MRATARKTIKALQATENLTEYRKTTRENVAANIGKIRTWANDINSLNAQFQDIAQTVHQDHELLHCVDLIGAIEKLERDVDALKARLNIE